MKKRHSEHFCEIYSDFTTKKTLKSVTVIDALPGGFNQSSALLPEPILIESFSTEKVLSSEVEEFHDFIVPEKKRYCKKCNKGLLPNRYFECKKCVPKLPEDINEHHVMETK
jgi:hypothetical protein